MSDAQEVLRGQQAQAVLDNPAYADSYAQLETEVINKWRDSRNADEREELHRQLMALQLMRANLEAMVRTGKLASAKLGRELSRAERMTAGWQRKAS